MAELNIVEASIPELQAALSSGALTSVDLVARYLQRISKYDCQDTALNSIPILNTCLFDEAAESDDRRASGEPVRLLEGIPYTVKDSYKVKGMTVAAASPAFRNLVANEDAFAVKAIREAGGVLIGRTNMPSMAYGGMQRGIYGRAESPYNPDYLAAAFASGSSNGSAVATAASFAAFGMGGETVSSGRSPASNNALVAYTPSRGCISLRGTWPLYPTCDVLVPHTRTMGDMLLLLDVIAKPDANTGGDFWRDQPFVKLPAEPWVNKPASFAELEKHTSLKGLRVAVPSIYIGGALPDGAIPVAVSKAVVELWEQARKDLESLGAEVIIVPDFPVVTACENASLLPEDCPRLPKDWEEVEKGPLISHGWNTFLVANQDPNTPDIASVDGLNIYPDRLRTSAELPHIPPPSYSVRWTKLGAYVRNAPMFDTKDLGEGLQTIETMRKRLLDDYLVIYGCDFFAFPAAGDVGAANADVHDESAEYAWRNGVKYSNGNRALRHLGVPSVSIPMGVMSDKNMPVNLTFAGRAYEDVDLLKWANAFEKATRRRIAPPCTPPLDSDLVSLPKGESGASSAARPTLVVDRCDIVAEDESNSVAGSRQRVVVEGQVTVKKELGMSGDKVPEIEITVDSTVVPAEQVTFGERQVGESGAVKIGFIAWALATSPVPRDKRSKTEAPVVRDQTMVVVLARCQPGGRPSGWLGLVQRP